MRMLLLSQSQDGSFVNLINGACRNCNCMLSVYTGKNENIDADVEVVTSTHYDSTTFTTRIKTWASFVKDAKRFLKRNIEQFDAIFFTSNPPVNQGLVKYAQKHNVKTIYLIWDIYPDCVEKSFGKVITPIAALWRKLNRIIYCKCDAVLTIGDVMRVNLQNSYASKISVIPYHTNTTTLHPIPKSSNPFAEEYDLTEKTVIMYSGKMGFGHGFDEILDAAKELQKYQQLKFVFIGFGSMFDKVKSFVENNKLDNTYVLPFQPIEKLPYTLGSADVSIISIKSETDGLFLPSKVYDAMSSGSAILCISAGGNDVAKMVQENKLGECVNYGSKEGIKAAILKLINDRAYLNECQNNARNLAEEKYKEEKIVSMYTDLFSRILDRK